MIYFLAAIGLYFLLNFVGYVMRQNNATPTNNKQFQASERVLSNPIEAQKIRQQHTPLMTEEMMYERIARVYSSNQGSSFEHFQHKMRFDFSLEENKYHQQIMKDVFEKEKQFVKKHGFNMNDNQIEIAISHLVLDFDETEMPYW
jgi:hypothetical protein